MGPIEIKSLKGTTTTNSIDLSGSIPYTLCQDVQLTACRKYEIQYSLYSITIFEKLLVTAYINMVNISSLVLIGPNVFGKQTQYFIPNITGTNQLCFN